jgi:hypothetical protein
MTAEVISIAARRPRTVVEHDLSPESEDRSDLHSFLDALKEDVNRATYIMLTPEKVVIGHSAKHKAELIVMLYQLQETVKYILENEDLPTGDENYEDN